MSRVKHYLFSAGRAALAAARADVEAEYQQVLQIAEENRQYWEERNRERLAEIASRPPTPAQEAVRARIQELEQKNKTPA